MRKWLVIFGLVLSLILTNISILADSYIEPVTDKGGIVLTCGPWPDPDTDG